MTVEDVRAAIALVRAEADDRDDEEAHVEQDAMYVAVLTAIAEGRSDDPAALCREALTVRDIEFHRYYV